MLSQEIVVDAGIVVEALQLGSAGDLKQIAVAGFILSQQEEVAGLFIQLSIPFAHASGCQISFHPHNGFDAGFAGGVVEIDHAEHGAMVGERKGRHVHLLGTRH